MKNPWVRLPPAAPFVLPEDEPHVRDYNQITGESSGRSAYVLDLDLLPVPYCGNWNAPIVVLGLNPFLRQGSDETTQRPELRKVALASLNDLSGNQPP